MIDRCASSINFNSAPCGIENGRSPVRILSENVSKEIQVGHKTVRSGGERGQTSFPRRSNTFFPASSKYCRGQQPTTKDRRIEE
jgi:hypothetical protein